MGLTITKEDIGHLRTEEFRGRIIVVFTKQEADKAVKYLLGYDRLGFDTETRPSFKKGKRNGVALIQLSTPDTCFLFRVNRLGFPSSLVELLSNPAIEKIGLSINDDFSVMHKKFNFTPAGFIDLQKMVKDFDIEDLSLQKIYALLFQKKISKSKRLSNWEADVLSEAQKQYAALDAWACLKIYEQLCLLK